MQVGAPLDPEEINRVKTVKGYIFNCKECLKQNTSLKTVSKHDAREEGTAEVIKQDSSSPTTAEGGRQRNSMKRCTSASQLKLPKLTQQRVSSRDTIASDILHKEVSQLCNVCSSTIAEDDTTCLKCSHLCHASCMGPGHIDVCKSCLAAEDQISQQIYTSNLEQSPDGSSMEKKRRIEDVSASQTHISSSKGAKQKVKTFSTGAASSANSFPNPPHIEDGYGVKHKDLRQLESKLKKWENELKLREARITDSTEEAQRLLDYIQKLEARNHEFETTIKAMKRKIDLLETGTASPTIPSHSMPAPPQTKENHQLILGVHEQVTKFVLRKVANQLIDTELMESVRACHPTPMGQRSDMLNAPFHNIGNDSANRAMSQQVSSELPSSKPHNQPWFTTCQPPQTEVLNFRSHGSQGPYLGPYGYNQSGSYIPQINQIVNSSEVANADGGRNRVTPVIHILPSHGMQAVEQTIECPELHTYSQPSTMHGDISNRVTCTQQLDMQPTMGMGSQGPNVPQQLQQHLMYRPLSATKVEAQGHLQTNKLQQEHIQSTKSMGSQGPNVPQQLQQHLMDRPLPATKVGAQGPLQSNELRPVHVQPTIGMGSQGPNIPQQHLMNRPLFATKVGAQGPLPANELRLENCGVRLSEGRVPSISHLTPREQNTSHQVQDRAAFVRGQPVFRTLVTQQQAQSSEPQSFLGKGRPNNGWT